jgi:hypothetical protein
MIMQMGIEAVTTFSALSKLFAQQAEQASKEKRDYSAKLEAAKGDEVFKYLLLINVASLESYVAQTRVQAEQSFRWSKAVAVIGFLIIAVGVSVAIYTSAGGAIRIEAAYLASLSGVVVEFVAGVFFYLYNRTLQQINVFHQRLADSQQLSISLIANSLIGDEVRRDQARAELARVLATTIVGERAPASTPLLPRSGA